MTPRFGRRMTLRQLLTISEKCSRDLIEELHNSLLPAIADFRDLSRPVRRHSHFPTLMAVHNSLEKLQQLNKESQALMDYLRERLQEIRNHAAQERVNRR